MRDGIIAVFAMFILLSVLFVVEGKVSKIIFTVITASASVLQIANGIREYISFPAKAEAARVDYAPPVSWWVGEYNRFVYAVLALAVLFFAAHIIFVWLERERVLKRAVLLTALMGVLTAAVTVMAALGYGISHINKYFDFASCTLAFALCAASVVILYTVTYIKWLQEKL